jgi:predicted transcriptional regulator
VSVKLDAEELARFKTLAEAKQRKLHFLMKEALRQYLDREEQRESFHREAMDSWREYQETGLHLTGAEVAAWLDTWGTDAETEIPACHE